MTAGDSLDNVAALVERQCAERHMQPICIIDCNEFGPFRRRRMIVDQVVDAERRAMDAPELPWRRFPAKPPKRRQPSLS